MATPLIPQEVYLLERYSSLDYFRVVRDNHEAMVKHVEQCLDAFVSQLPPDYRSRPLPKQPDIVWGERVLPNFRETLQGLYEGYIMVSHGELNGLGAASEVESDRRGAVEFWDEWMDEPQVTAKVQGGAEKYWDLLGAALTPASNISHTIERHWAHQELDPRVPERDLGPLQAPEQWPRYRLNAAVQVRTGETVPCNGIYLPDIDLSCPSLQLAGEPASKARFLIGMDEGFDDDGVKCDEVPITEGRDATWTLIERVPGETVPFEEGAGPIESAPQRIPAGKPCPRSGHWFTPAKQNSRRHFKQGDVFPEIEGSSYGATFWQWSPDQSDPKL